MIEPSPTPPAGQDGREWLSHQGVSRETLAQLDAYVDLLTRWNARINLVAPTSLSEVWERHVADCAQLDPLIPGAARTLVDLGSGAGLPGLILAILRPSLQVTLIETDSRKAAFLAEAVRELALTNVGVACKRVERFTVTRPPAIVTARALKPLPILLGLARPLIGPDTLAIFPKGRKAAEEVAAARAGWSFDLETIASATSEEARILLIRHAMPLAAPPSDGA